MNLSTRLRHLPDRIFDRYAGKIPDRFLFAAWSDWWWQALCVVFGHDPIPDQCDNPDHDYCAWCAKPMPGAAHET